MRNLTTLLLAGAASLALAGAAVAQTLPTHRMTVRLPDGTAAQIEYTGNVAPQVEIVPATTLAGDYAPFWGKGDPVFAQFEQISAAMDRAAAAMMQQVAALMALPPRAMPMTSGPDSVWRIDASNLPPGAQSYTFAATLGPDGVCAQSMTITPGRDGWPHVVTHQSESCGDPNATYAVPDARPDLMPPRPAPGVLSVKATPPADARPRDRGALREAAYVAPNE